SIGRTWIWDNGQFGIAGLNSVHLRAHYLTATFADYLNNPAWMEDANPVPFSRFKQKCGTGATPIMITRLYVNNFRCLVAFEAKFESLGLLCGPNGSGKSSVFDVLKLIRDLATAEAVLGGEGPRDIRELEFTNWLDSTVQEFELTVRKNDHEFEYKLHIEQRHDDVKPRVVFESATCDGRSLFTRDLEGVSFVRADGTKSSFPLDWRQAALGSIQPYGSLRDTEILQDTLRNTLILRPNPRSMELESKGESRRPTLSMDNLLAWYRNLAQEQEWTDILRESLKEVWPDFVAFRQQDTGINAKTLQLRFDSDQGREAGLYSFHQLSDGEKALLALYMIRAALESGRNGIVFIDEPDNYVGLPELQPWVLAMCELLDEDHQAILISHHPEVLENIGDEYGSYLWRDNHTSPTRIGPLRIPEGLSAGEAIRRGWL
ncbi:MAG: AAA family ATPase, partial [Planctomycetales bacterium]|nr:AAA family ATPase [Planctomycetales bacterium]